MLMITDDGVSMSGLMTQLASFTHLLMSFTYFFLTSFRLGEEEDEECGRFRKEIHNWLDFPIMSLCEILHFLRPKFFFKKKIVKYL